MADYELAQLNIAELKYPIDSPPLADFVNNIDRINTLAEESVGFVWRLQSDYGDPEAMALFGENTIINMSVWRDRQVLHDYVYRSAHIEIMRRKQEWFHTMKQSHMVLWWVPTGHRPTLEEAKAKLEILHSNGPTAEAFTFKQDFPAPQ